MKYLEGDNIAPLSTEKARELIGKRIIYLRKCDIDRSGRGYFFPQYGIVADVFRGHIAIDDPSNFIGTLKSLVEVVVSDTKSVTEDAR